MSLYELFTTFSNNILPIIFIAGGGYLLGKFLSVDPRTVGRLVFYLFSPVLIFDLLTSNRLPVRDVLLTGAFTTSNVLGTGLLAFIGGSLLRLERTTLMGVTIAAMFANNGNYGLPLVKFAFGNEALAHSSLYFVFSTILLNTVGVIIASLGHTDFKRAALGLVRVPAVYAVLIAFLVIQFGITIPIPVQRTISIMAGASVPMMLVLLGLELQRAQWTRDLRALSIGTFVRLIIGPALALGLSAIYGLNTVSRQGSIIEAAMPSAVASSVLAAEYRIDTTIVTATILLTTLLSPLTLTLLIVYLK